MQSSHVHPSNIITDDIPGILPDFGITCAINIPLLRDTGINSESGLISFVPLCADEGVHSITITVDDGNGGTDTEQFNLEIEDEDDK